MYWQTTKNFKVGPLESIQEPILFILSDKGETKNSWVPQTESNCKYRREE